MLKKYRKQIDKIDKKLIKLFEKRMEISKSIGEYKKEHNMEIFDSEREKEILKDRALQTKNPENREYVVEFFENLMNISKKKQSK